VVSTQSTWGVREQSQDRASKTAITQKTKDFFSRQIDILQFEFEI